MISLIRVPMLDRLLGRKPKRKPKTLKPVKLPWSEQMRYSAELMAIVRETEAAVRKFVVPNLGRLSGEANQDVPQPRADDVADELSAMIAYVRSLVFVAPERAAQIAIEMLERVQGQHARRFVIAYDDALAIDPLVGQEPWLLEQMGLRTQENVALIQSLPEDLLFDVETTITRELLKGTHARDIAALLSERFDVSENRALLIATDQTNKWFGSLNKLRQLDAGVTEYEWITANDGAVRPKHRELNHKIRKWGEGIEPGSEIRCRCQAVPQLPEFDEPEEE